MFAVFQIYPLNALSYNAGDLVIDGTEICSKLISTLVFSENKHIALRRYLLAGRDGRTVQHAHIHADVTDNRKSVTIDFEFKTAVTDAA